MIQNTPEVKQLNRENIRADIQKRNSFTKAEVARSTGLSVATSGYILNEMLEVAPDERSVGRPAKRYEYNKDFFHVIGMSLWERGDHGEIVYVIADALGNTVKQDKAECSAINYEDIARIVEQETCADPLIRNITVGIPGIAQNGIVESCDIKSLVGVDVAGQLRIQFRIAAEVKNKMYFIVIGAHDAIKPKSRDLVAVYFPSAGNGFVGSGMIINGKVVEGHSQFAGQLEYIGTAYGFGRVEQEKVLNDRSAFCRYVAQTVMSVSAMVDPEVILLMGNNMMSADVNEVHDYCRQFMGEHHIPRLMTDPDNHIDYYYARGLVRSAIVHLCFSVRLRDGVL